MQIMIIISIITDPSFHTKGKTVVRYDVLAVPVQIVDNAVECSGASAQV